MDLEYLSEITSLSTSDKSFLIKHEFNYFHPIKSIYMNYGCIPNRKGVYVVVSPSGKVKFKETTDAIEQYNNRNLTASITKLEDNLVYDSNMLYIGRASGESNKLQQRIKQYVKYGYHLADNHRGGRYIWQIIDNKDLLIGYSLKYEKDAVIREKELIREYFSIYGKKPFANLQF